MQSSLLKKTSVLIQALLFLFTGLTVVKAQTITGVWRGKINQQKIEVKIIQRGYSLTGTTYYYESPEKYSRYSIKGYFDPGTNEAVWWDHELIENAGSASSSGKTPLLSRADFNYPGYGRMILGGQASHANNEKEHAGDFNLDKTDRAGFTDEWDFVLENFTMDNEDPAIIDSIEMLSMSKKPVEEKRPHNPAETAPLAATTTAPKIPDTRLTGAETKNAIFRPEPLKPLDISEKFLARKKVFAAEIPVTTDSIELHFYDNAQIDGDSISLFLNDQLIFEHIRLTDKAYIIKLAASSLLPTNELIMVAENMGTIPPNTSYMIALVGEQRYEARLESTEGSSALIRLVRK